MTFARRLVAACAVIATTATLAASATQQAGAATQSKPKSGGTITFLTSSEATTLDNVRITASGAAGAGNASQLVYDSLVTIDPETQKPMMRLAKSLTSSADSKVWTIKLRPGLTFSDSTPLNAAAVVANWDRHKNPALASACLSTATTLGSYVAQDDTTVQITLPEARVAFPFLLAGCLGVIESPTAVAKFGSSYGTSPETTVGAGPFLLKEWVRGSQSTYVRNPNYWDKPRPYVDSIILKPVIDTTQKLSAFQAGQADLALFVTLNPQIEALKSQGAQLWGYPAQGGGSDVAFNQSVPALKDLRIRQALVLATDPKDLNAKASGGTNQMVDTYFVKGFPYYDPSVKQVTNNLKKAQSLVDDYVKQNGPVELTFLLSDSLTTWGQAQAQSWARLKNLTVKIDQVPATNSNARLTTGDWQMAVTAIAPYDPENMYNLLYSTSRQNVIKYNNPKVDAALTQLRGETNAKKAQELYTTITKNFVDDAAVVYWYRLYLPYAIRSGISGVTAFSPQAPDMTKLWIAKSR
jgi:ABC-type transport system substrate-binding protein